MITAFLFTFLINSVRVVMDMLGVPVITTLPGGVDSAVAYMFGMVFAVWDTLWIVQAPFLALTAFLAYKVVMVSLQAFLGHRVSHG